MRPSSSTSSVTAWPSKPFWAITTSTSSVVPLSAVRGSSTRPIWMSLSSVSRPTPTVKTGTASALRPSSASPSAASAVSAPSLTTPARPAAGRQFLPRRRQRGARRVSVPSNFSRHPRPPALPSTRSGTTRTVNRSARVLRVPASRAPRRCTYRRTRLPVCVGNLHRARVVQQDADDVLLRHRRPDHEHGPEQARQHEQQQRHAQRGEHQPIAQRQLRASAIADERRGNGDRGDRHGHERAGPRRPADVPLREHRRGIFEEEPKQGLEHGISGDSTWDGWRSRQRSAPSRAVEASPVPR